MDNIYTIPVNIAFEEAVADNSPACPFCSLYNELEDNELELILGASMMEPDIRIKTNKEGFCKTHYDMMFTRKNRLGMALTLESHLAELQGDLKPKLFSKFGDTQRKRIAELESNCYVCKRIEFNFVHMIETAVILWDNDDEFKKKMSGIKCFCLPHYRRLLDTASDRLGKKQLALFEEQASGIVNSYMASLSEDVSWFCKKFDYRYDAEPWYNSKDAVERSMKFLRSDLHKPPKKKKELFNQ